MPAPTWTLVNPATEEPFRSVPFTDPSELVRLVHGARVAQRQWRHVPVEERVRIVSQMIPAFRAMADTVALDITRQMGKPLRQSFNEINTMIDRTEAMCRLAAPALADEPLPEKTGFRRFIRNEPHGVVLDIAAWNYPLLIAVNVVVPALLAGNAVLYKPSEYASMTGLEIARLLHESGVPEDVFIALIGAGEVGAELLKHDIDGVFFTGSYGTGRRIAEAVRGRMLKLQLELGGKDPIYVCDDVDAVTVAAGIADGAFYNTGQSCCSVERIYVNERIFEPFVAAFAAEVRGYVRGEPDDDKTYIGPLTRAPQVEVLDAQVKDAVKKGAKVLVGGKRVKGKGNWFEPTVLVDVNHTMDVMREESFGPIIGIMSVKDDAEAAGAMNDTEYGLTAGVYSTSRSRAEKILEQVKAGSVYWNCCDRVSPRLPWSGVGHSGIGLTLSTYGIEAFTRPKAWHLRT